MSHGTRLGVLATVALIVSGCSGSVQPGETASPEPGTSASFLADAYVGLPTRLLVTVTPAVAGADVQVTVPGGSKAVAQAQTDASGRAWSSWVPGDAGPLTATATVTSSGKVAGSAEAQPVSTTVADPEPPSTPATRSDPVSGVFEGGGQQMWVDCRGSGGPTMVLIAGAWGWSKDWDPLVDDLEADGRVCTYDRPGLGSSPGRTGALTISAGDNADELAALLANAGEKGPYLVVGHSYGGLIARAFNYRHPELTAGMALLDPVPAYYYDRWTAAYRTLEEGTPRVTMDIVASSEASGGYPPLTGLPLVVIAAGVGRTDEPAIAATAWRELQQETADASDNSLFLVAEGATHQLQETATALSLAAITELRAASREHRPLTSAASLSAAAGG